MHRPTNQLRKSIGESRSAETYTVAELSERPWVPGTLMNELKGLADVRIVDGSQPSALARFEGTDPTTQNFDKDHFRNMR